MKIIDIAQRSNAWHVWRRRGVTASDAAVLLGRSPYKTLWRLWAEKTGIAVEEDVSRNPFVQYGLCNEDSARQAEVPRLKSLGSGARKRRGERNLPALLSASAASNPRDGCGRWLSRVLASRRDTGVPDTARRPADSVADRKGDGFLETGGIQTGTGQRP